MGILDGIVEWIAEQIMYGLDMINTSVLGALGCDMNTFLRYFPAAKTMYSLLVALAIGLILLGWIWNLFKNYGLGLGIEAEDPVRLTAKAILFIVSSFQSLCWRCSMGAATFHSFFPIIVHGRKPAPCSGLLPHSRTPDSFPALRQSSISRMGFMVLVFASPHWLY